MKDKLIHDCIQYNGPDVNIITQYLKLPWLKLNTTFPVLSDEYVHHLHKISNDWRNQWKFDLENKIGYQVKGWNGNVLFAPNLEQLVDIVENNPSWKGKMYDEDCQCKMFRSELNYSWRVDTDDPIRKWVNSLAPDNDINLVNTYFLPPGGYVFPHRDYSIEKIGLAKIYIAAKWGDGNTFGMYGVGNMPIEENDVYLINNYTLPHWVHNNSNKLRMVIDISSNLASTKIEKLIIESFQRKFLVK